MDDHNDSAVDPPEMRWDGWGDPSRATELPRAVRALLPLMLGRVPRPAPSPDIGDVQVDASRLTDADLIEIRAVVGEEHASLDPQLRIRRAAGRSTPDLLRRRAPHQRVPDAVVRPADHAEVSDLLGVAAQRDIAVVPFGGGTGVVGGVDPDAGAHRAVIALDLARLSGLTRLDETSGEAVLLAGTRAPEAERLLAERGFELGHYPQSFRYATIGGFATTRSSGQNSAGHGRFETMVTGIRMASPTGDLDLGRAPGSAAGPDLTRLLLGSEGVFGVITEVRVRVHRTPVERIVESWTFPDFETGATALREVVQREGGPTVIRLSDEAETGVSLAQLGRLGKVLAKGASAITVFEGDDAEHRRERTAALITAAGGTGAGRTAADDWARTRFDGPYLRDALLEAGVFCETLETATTWSKLHALRAAVTAALRDGFAQAGAKSFVMCHVSHVYPTGASLYFTVLAGVKSEPLGVWEVVKHRVGDAIMAAGGTITHHHAVGRDHAPWLTDEIGETGIRVLRAIKRELDPHGIMNPGVLLPDEPRDG
jgi:alkyldihydroxyacetonephosphate synthase